MERRQFLKWLALGGTVAGAGFGLWYFGLRQAVVPTQPKVAEAPDLPPPFAVKRPFPVPQPLIAKVEGPQWDRITGEVIQKLGGMKKFVNPGETVVVKPNMAWDRPPELAANAHPDVVRQVVELCLDAGAKQVKVLDHTCHDARKAYKNSGIQDAVRSLKDSRAVVEFVDERRFVKVKADKAKSLKEWLYYKDILEADRLINIPVAKHHSESRLTLCLKNMMGAIGGWRGRCHVGLHQNIADMNLVLRPDLHVLDCTRILLRNGPTGGDLADVAVKNLVLAGTDPVALDAHGATLFGLQPSDIGYIFRAHALGLGEMDLNKVEFI